MTEFAVLGIFLVIDQVSKWWFQMHDLVVMNAGGVFGVMPSLWWGIVLLVVWGFITWEWWRMDRDISRWGMGLIVVGGLGNLIDRLLFGSVRDFIYYPGFRFYGNIADILLALGVAAALVGKLKKSA